MNSELAGQLAAICARLPDGPWSIQPVHDLGGRLVNSAGLSIFARHDRGRWHFSPSTPPVEGQHFTGLHNPAPRVTVSSARSAEAIAGDLHRRLWPTMTKFLAEYEAWRDELIAYRDRKQSNLRLLMEVAGVTRTYGGSEQVFYNPPESPFHWKAQVESDSVRLDCTVDIETAAAGLGLQGRLDLRLLVVEP